MPAGPKTVTEEVVRKVADLSRLRLPDGELALWADQLARIVAYIDQIARIPEAGSSTPAPARATPLRPDEARAGEGAGALERNAARRFEGFGVVPRVVGGGE